MASSAFALPSPEPNPGANWAAADLDNDSGSGFMRSDSFDDNDAQNIELRKEAIDRAFDKLLAESRRNNNNHSIRPNFVDHDEEISYSGGDLDDPDDENNYNLHRNSEDESNDTENLDDFSGLEELGLSDDDELINGGELTEHIKRKPRQPRGYPPSRKQRGFHKWAGRVVALLSTGEVGYVLEKPGGRITVRLYESGVEVSASEEKLRVLENTGSEAVEEIYQYARYVPQLKDLKVGQRVAMIKYENATGRVIRLPDERRAMMGLGHVVVRMDNSNEQRKAVVESLRLIDDSHPVIPLNTQTVKTVGRPTKAVVANKAAPQQIQALLPYSKRGDAWKESLRPPGPVPPPSPLFRKASRIDSENGSSASQRKEPLPYEEQPYQKRAKALGSEPRLTRGRKLCHSCRTVIGTACKSCAKCGARCPRRNQSQDIAALGNGDFKSSSASSGSLGQF